jgi:hypothetical protein
MVNMIAIAHAVVTHPVADETLWTHANVPERSSLPTSASLYIFAVCQPSPTAPMQAQSSYQMHAKGRPSTCCRLGIDAVGVRPGGSMQTRSAHPRPEYALKVVQLPS